MLHQLAVGGIPRNNGFVFQRHVAQVQPQIGFAVFFARAVANKAIFRKDGANIAIELDVGSLGDAEARERCAQQNNRGNSVTKRYHSNASGMRVVTKPSPKWELTRSVDDEQSAFVMHIITPANFRSNDGSVPIF